MYWVIFHIYVPHYRRKRLEESLALLDLQHPVMQRLEQKVIHTRRPERGSQLNNIKFSQ